MTSGDGSATAKLFYQSLVASYVDSDPHFVERAWLAERIERHLHDPACRFVLLTAEPGAGKTALMAWLARRRPDALRYFIRRDSQTPLSSGDAQSLLFTLGQQLAVLHPGLFHPDKLQVAVTQRVEEVAADAVMIGIRVADLYVSPFYATALRVEQNAGLVAGELIGVDAARLRVEDRLLDCENLQHLALLAPALALSSADPAARIVVLIDALDELRYQVGQGGVLDWLASCPELPESLRIIVSSRPDDEQLARFRAAQQRWLREESIDHDSVEVQADLGRFIERVTEQPLVATALAVHRVDPFRFTTRAVAQADGNFQYLVALARAIEQAVGYAEASDYGGEGRAQPDGLHPGRDLERLLRFEGVPSGLEDLYAFFLKLVRDSVKDDHVEVGGPQFSGRAWAPAWPALYQPILGLLAVAQEPLGASQLREFADIQAGDHWLQHALKGLGQFLERDNGRYRLYHASFAEFITATSTRTTHPDFYLDPTEWHGRVVEQALATHRAGRSWLVADGYVRAHLAAHAAGAGRLDELLEDPVYLAAANPDRLLRVLPAANASRALTAEGLVRRVGSRLRGRPIGQRAAVLELAARQLGADWMAGPLAELPLQRPWSARWAHPRPTSADRLLGTHDGQVNAVALGERDERAVVVSAGHDGMVRVWDLRTNKPLLAWRHGDGAVEAVAVGGVARRLDRGVWW